MRYLGATSNALQHLKTRKMPATVSDSHVKYALELARGYIKDSRHYLEKRKPVTALACVAYAEGLLDALKFLELVDL